MGDADADEFGGAFAVTDDELRELLRERRDDFCDGFAVFRGQRCDGVAACGAVGQESEGVIGGGVAIDADGVEGAIHGVFEEGSKGCGGDGSVCEEHAEESGHVGVDHAGAFGHACETIDCAWGGREAEGAGKEFGEGIGCTDGLGGTEPVVVSGGEGGVGSRDGREDLGDG